MNKLLLGLFVHPIEGTEPRIVDLEQPMLIVGMSTDTTLRNIYRDLPALGRRYHEYRRQHAIPHLKVPWAFAAVSKDYDQSTGALTYVMGDVVTEADPDPGMATVHAFAIPAITYAVFPVRPRFQFAWGLAIPDAKRYAYTVWMSGADYEPAGPIDDFEYHDQRSLRKRDPEIDLYVAIKKS